MILASVSSMEGSETSAMFRNLSTRPTVTYSDLPKTGALVVSGFQLLFGFLGLVGNIGCLIATRKRAKTDNTSWLLANQFVIDFITSMILIANTIHLTWIDAPLARPFLEGELFCRLWASGLIYFTGFAISSFNLAAIAVERYVAVVHPMEYGVYFKQSMRYLLAGVVWLAAPIMEVILILAFHKYEHGECILTGDSIRKIVGLLVFVWEFVVPVIIMSYSFLRIALKFGALNRVSAANPLGVPSAALQESANIEQQRESTGTSGDQSATCEQPVPRPTAQLGGHIRRRSITCTLFIFFISYLVCWIPNQVMYLATNFGLAPNYYGSTFHSLTVVLATLNICINPLVYVLRYLTSRPGHWRFGWSCSTSS